MATNDVHLLLSVDFPVADFTIYPSANLAGELAAPVVTGEITAPVIWGELAAPESITGPVATAGIDGPVISPEVSS